MKTRKIGMFDSGVGGFSILQEVFLLLPSAEVFYIADDLHSPYGEKKNNFLNERCRIIVEELLTKGVDLIVVACNTATASSIKYLRENFDVPFVGVEPFLNVRRKYNLGIDKKIVSLTTELTFGSEKYSNLKNKTDPEEKVDHFICKNLAALIEKAFYSGATALIIEEIKDDLSLLIGKKYDYAILGCTHYSLIEEFIEMYLSVKCISPSSYIAKRVIDLLGICSAEGEVKDKFYFKSTKRDNFEIKEKKEIRKKIL